jgi:hypothetical protein
MKTRIIEETDSFGRSKFYPQRKFLWFWVNFFDPYNASINFRSLREAHAWVNYKPNVKTKIHKSNEE